MDSRPWNSCKGVMDEQGQGTRHGPSSSYEGAASSVVQSVVNQEDRVMPGSLSDTIGTGVDSLATWIRSVFR
jgi:hypothetical protein